MVSMDRGTRGARRAVKGIGASLLLGLLLSCGGGTEQIDAFEPNRYMVFGDEQSVITRPGPQGLKYTVNAVGDDGVSPDCTVNTSSQPARLWTQVLANVYNFVFEDCNPSARPVNAFIYAVPKAKADDVVAQIAAAQAERGPFGCRDLMSVLVGVNDVIDLYENEYLANPTSSNANAIANELSARGARVGRAIAAITAADNRPAVIVSTMQRVSQTPYARQQASVRPDVNARGVLQQFSDAFNTALRTNIPNDGSRWGLVELDALVNAAVGSPGNYGLNNVTQGVCAVDLPNCTNVPADLVTGGNAERWLWANDRWIGWQAHARLGSFARTRVQDNPFGCN